MLVATCVCILILFAQVGPKVKGNSESKKDEQVGSNMSMQLIFFPLSPLSNENKKVDLLPSFLPPK